LNLAMITNSGEEDCERVANYVSEHIAVVEKQEYAKIEKSNYGL